MATVTGTPGQDFIHQAGDGETPPAGFNEITGVSGGSDSIRAGDGDDIVYGQGSRDTIVGEGGADTLLGGEGGDFFAMVRNSDVDGLAESINGGGGIDVFVINGEGGALDVSQMTVSSVEFLIVNPVQTPFAVTMTPDKLSGFTEQISSFGSIVLSETGAVAVTDMRFRLGELIGSAGSDDVFLNVRFDDDLIVKAGAGNDRIRILSERADSFRQPTNTLNGEDGEDTMVGGRYEDLLDGGDGNDRLFGGKQQDMLTGGEGADRFKYRSVNDSRPDLDRRDLIADFSQIEKDLIDLRAIDADAIQAGDQAFFLGGSAFTGVAGELIQNVGGGVTLLAGDSNGDGDADFQVQIAGELTLTDGDFLL